MNPVPHPLDRVLEKGWVKVRDQAKIPLQLPKPQVRQWKGNAKSQGKEEGEGGRRLPSR
jgi:hypothetical protein